VRFLAWLLIALLVAVALGPVSWAGEVNPAGEYDFVLFQSSLSGTCPLGRDGQGRLTVEKSETGYRIQYLQGMTCRPETVCILSGSCRGDRCTFTTTVKVDDDGGKVTNSAELTFSGRQAQGKGRSVYNHPSGFQCTWTYLLTLTRRE